MSKWLCTKKSRYGREHVIIESSYAYSWANFLHSSHHSCCSFAGRTKGNYRISRTTILHNSFDYRDCASLPSSQTLKLLACSSRCCVSGFRLELLAVVTTKRLHKGDSITLHRVYDITLETFHSIMTGTSYTSYLPFNNLSFCLFLIPIMMAYRCYIIKVFKVWVVFVVFLISACLGHIITSFWLMNKTFYSLS